MPPRWTPAGARRRRNDQDGAVERTDANQFCQRQGCALIGTFSGVQPDVDPQWLHRVACGRRRDFILGWGCDHALASLRAEARP